MDQDGQLSAAEFAVAMHLIHATIKGIQLPSSLPQALVDFLEAVTHPKLPPPADNHLQKCRSAFVSFQTNNGRGVLGGKVSRQSCGYFNLSCLHCLSPPPPTHTYTPALHHHPFLLHTCSNATIPPHNIHTHTHTCLPSSPCFHCPIVAEAARYLLVKSNLQRESVIHIWYICLWGCGCWV